MNFYALCTNKEWQASLGKEPFPIDINDAAKLNEQHYDIFWTPNGFDFGKRKKEDLKTINYFYADLDAGTEEEMLERIKDCLPPSFIVKTGKGFHVYWMLDIPIDCSDDPVKWADWFRDFNKNRILPKLNSDPQAADACRLLRASFFKYWKDGSGRHCDIVLDSDRKYSLKVIEKYFPVVRQELKTVVMKPKELVGDFWTKANALDCRYSLERLSGSPLIGGETITFKPESGITRIVVNGKSSNAWLDKNGKIGSTAGAGPSIVNWLSYYRHDMKKIAEILKETFKELENG